MAALVSGLVLIFGGMLMDVNRVWLIRHVTSRSLGSLAPGYASSDRGVRIYTGLVRAIGVIVLSLWVLSWSVEIGGLLLVAGTGGFVVLSAIAITGEVKTYHALKH
ncbi:MAG TPA: hypothetical protein DCK96_00710 [Chloroflexi bacterium]|jgi:hypothetical protein|nr:hypothetical protein [Chloroflexota bacterium]